MSSTPVCSWKMFFSMSSTPVCSWEKCFFYMSAGAQDHIAPFFFFKVYSYQNHGYG